MYHRVRLLHQVLAIRIQGAVFRSEVVMDRCALEYALLHSTALAQLVVVDLHYHAQALNKEYSTQYRQQQLLVYHDGTNGYDAADGERTRVAHEHLCRVGIVPQETYQRTDESAEKYH